MTAKQVGSGSAANPAKERPGTPAPKEVDPTNCDSCGKKLGVWFSLNDKAYCSPCFHSKFWTPFESVKSKA